MSRHRHRRDFLCVGRPYDASCPDGDEAGPVGLLRRRHRGIDQDMPVTNHVAEVCCQRHDNTARRTVFGMALRAATTSGA